MSDNVSVEELLEELSEIVEKAWNFPLGRGRAMLDVEEVREILGEIREAMPQEIRQAKAIVADRKQIIDDAKREAETIVRVAEERARAMVNQDEIVRQAAIQVDIQRHILRKPMRCSRRLRRASARCARRPMNILTI